jgi:iron(III) transport system permease protein
MQRAIRQVAVFLTGSRGSGSGALAGMALAALWVSALLAAPILAVMVNGLSGGQGAWEHLSSTVLPDYISTTVWLACGVAVGVVVFGVSSAWLVTTYRFPGSHMLQWGLALPLAVPAYVVAYAYSDFFQFQGPVQSSLRALTGWGPGDYRFPDIRSLGGAIVVFSVVLYPYVYLLARAAFLDQSRNLLNAGRLLGVGPWGVFFKVALPMARPAVAAGTALALMETLADFGAVSYFGVQTFTTGIFRAWQSMNDLVAASQLSAALLLLVFVILAIERWNRGGARQYDSGGTGRRRTRLSGVRAWAVAAWCVLPPFLGFVLPALVLSWRVWSEPGRLFTERFASLAVNSFTLAGITALAAVGLALLLVYAARLSASPAVAWGNRLSGLGYAMPGAVIAVGVLVPVARMDNLLADWLEAAMGIKVGLIFTGGILALVFAYLVRFLAVALQTVEAGLAKVRPSMEDAARGLGASPWQVLSRVHVPMLAPSLLTAGLIVFVDVMKELPATFVMRPFNFDTLAVQAYHYASDERLPQAAAASLVIVAVGLLPVILLSRATMRSRMPR